jgi:hypothetical protein
MEEPPPVAVGVDKAVRIHESKVLRLVVGRASRGDGLRDEIVHLLTALAIEAEQDLHSLGRIADGLGGKLANLGCVISMTKIVSLMTMHAAVWSVNCGLWEKPSALKKASDFGKSRPDVEGYLFDHVSEVSTTPFNE